ncbi:DUF262 domain-containing protein [Aliiroseovarius sp. PrR006]|uniref:DUF262 domain-containing protein n=1 Tax=Aliiroseovarius sp. PrR006 TaxID=2706883 RepID=UPI0013D2EC66|nr:DUF262 domain-containing protein [Aliiroseovarius sp. PrR006]NDW53615.1 DUF262 domain-containing protein [Aliiroseovarius sp. PrR006]
MSLEAEVKAARNEISPDGYEMSVGEIMNLYRDGELVIDPAFQRLFRWDETRKTRFIESLLLGIPVPPIFVFQDESGVWELIDGLQRLSTIFQFTGILKGSDGEEIDEMTLEGTTFLPSLSGKKWSADNAQEEIGQALQIQIKRARLRVEILKQESDPLAKFELFQRLNTGGASLSEQEIRNCIAVMLNRDLHDWLQARAQFAPFVDCTQQTERAVTAQMNVELVLRYLAYVHQPYEGGLDVHDYLDSVLANLANNNQFNFEQETANFERTFQALHNALGANAFKRWDGAHFRGKFLMSVFEVLTSGVANNLDAIYALDDAARSQFIEEKAKSLWENDVFQANSGGGVRGTTRLQNLLPMSREFLAP